MGSSTAEVRRPLSDSTQDDQDESASCFQQLMITSNPVQRDRRDLLKSNTRVMSPILPGTSGPYRGGEETGFATNYFPSLSLLVQAHFISLCLQYNANTRSEINLFQE